MERRKTYTGRRFSADAIAEAGEQFRRLLPIDENEKSVTSWLKVSYPEEEFKFDSEQEFYTEYRKGTYRNASYNIGREQLVGGPKMDVQFSVYGDDTHVTVSDPRRANIDQIFEIFERHLPDAEIRENVSEPDPPVTVFIGHGHSSTWRDLKDHLHEQHGYAVQAYEVGARAGHTIRDVLETMLMASTFAVVVMTGDDETASGGLRARQNVVHEAGLFQGRLGFSRCIAVVEEGVETFTNLDGIHQLRFRAGRIRETFGDVVATLRREFPQGDS